MLKTGMEAEEDCNVFNYGPPRTQEEVKLKESKIVSGPGGELEQTFFSQGITKLNLSKKIPWMR